MGHVTSILQLLSWRNRITDLRELKLISAVGSPRANKQEKGTAQSSGSCRGIKKMVCSKDGLRLQATTYSKRGFNLHFQNRLQMSEVRLSWAKTPFVAYQSSFRMATVHQ